MAIRFRVRQGGSIIAPGKIANVFRAGTVLPEGLFTPAMLEEHVRSGFAEPINAPDAMPLADEPTPTPPGQESTPVIPSGMKDDRATPPSERVTLSDAASAKGRAPRRGRGDAPVALTTDGGPGTISQSSAKKPSTAPVVQAKSIWTLNPADLMDKTIDELNVMVAERDEKVPPFETVEEVRAFLSADFRG